MRKLTRDELTRLATRPNVKRIAVENFLMSIPAELEYRDAIDNLRIDAGVYNWNEYTKDAIYEGLTDMYRNDALAQL